MTKLRLLAIATAALIAGTTAPTAVQAARPGDTVPLTGLEMPPGSVAASHSGVDRDGHAPSSLSADGRYLAFTSMAEELAPGSNPDVVNVYRKDRATGAVVLVSRASGANGAGVDRNAGDAQVSLDGNVISFATEAALTPADTNGATDVYVRNVATGTTTLATPGLTSGT